jgi:hemerythrin-like metal-binding protein
MLSTRDVIEWKPEYSVAVEAIDKQHQALVALIAHLQEAMLEGRTKQVVGPLFASMNRYTKYHFAFEEKLLEENGYPGLEAHRNEHARLIAELKELESKYLQGSLAAGAPLMKFLRTWLVNHICVHDKEYGVYLSGKSHSRDNAEQA